MSDSSAPPASAPDDAASSTAAAQAHVADPWGLVLAGLIAVRLVITGHAPNLFDAAIAGGLALLLLRSVLVGGGIDRTALAVVGTAMAVAVVSASASVHPLLSAWAVPGFLAPFLAFAAVRAEGARSQQRVCVALVLAGSLHALVALYQRLISYPDALARADELNLAESTRALLSFLRPIGLSVSPDLAGGLALMTALLGAKLLLGRPDDDDRRAQVLRALGGVAVALGLGAVVASRSSGTAVALLVAVATLAWAARGGALSPRTLVVAGLAAVVAAGVAFRGLAALSASAGERLTNWSVALELGLDHPLGVGLARFGPMYLANRPAESNVTQYAHSTLAHWWAELGVLGMVLLLGLAGAALVAIARLPVDERRRRALWLAALAAFAARAMVDYDLQVGQSAVAFGVVAGLALSRAPGTPGTSPVLSRARGAQVLACAITAVCLLPLIDLVPREQALAPYERGGDEGRQDIGKLLRFANAHPGDVVANSVAARLEIATLASCPAGAGCEAVERTLRRRVDLADDLAPAEALHVAAAQLALLRGDLEEAEAQARSALDDHPGAWAAWRVLLDSARLHGPERTQAVIDEATPWLLPGQLSALVAPPPPPAADGEPPRR